MKKFVIQVAIFVFLVGTIAWGICPLGELDDNSMVASIADKNQRLREPSERPRIVFLGGSSVLMGTDSKFIADSIGDYKPVNMAIFARFGIDFILNNSLPNIRKGDLVVLGIEYNIFTDERRNGRFDYRHDARMYDKASLLEMNFKQAKTFLDKSLYRYMLLFQNKTSEYKIVSREKGLSAKLWWQRICTIRNRKVNNPSHPYFRDCLNQAGDLVSHLDMKSRLGSNVIVFKGPIDKKGWQKTIDVINEFTEKCEKKGARVVFFLAMVSEYNYKVDPELFDTFADYFESTALPKLLNRPDESLVRDDHFFDTGYHLNGQGRQIRSELLARKLKKFLETNEQEKLCKDSAACPE